MIRLLSCVMLVSISLVSAMPQSQTSVTQNTESVTPIVATPASKLDHNDDGELDHTHAEPETEPETEPQAESEAEPESKTEAEPESETEAEPKSKSEPEPEAESDSKAEPEPEAESEPEVEPEIGPESESEPYPESEAEVEPEAEPNAEAEPEAEPEKTVQPQVAKVEPGLADPHPHPAVTKGERQPKNAQAPVTQPVVDNRNSANNLAGGMALSLVFTAAAFFL